MMYIQFVLHGATEGSVADEKERQVVVQIPDAHRNNPQNFIDAVMKDVDVDRQVAAILPLDENYPTSLVDLQGGNVDPSRVAGQIILKTRDNGPFHSYINRGSGSNFMTYRLAKHLVSIIEHDLGVHPLNHDIEESLRYQALARLKTDLEGHVSPQGHIFGAEIRQMLASLDTAVTQSMLQMKEQTNEATSKAARGREFQYLRAAIEFGSKDGSFQFLDRCADIKVSPGSVFADEHGAPVPAVTERLKEVLDERFPAPLSNSMSIVPTSDGHRVLFTQVEADRMTRALSEFSQAFRDPDHDHAGGVVFLGEGNCNITRPLLEKRYEDVLYRSQVPMLMVPGLNDEGLVNPKTRSSKDLMVEARRFIAQHAGQYEGKYQMWRKTVDELENKTRALARGYEKYDGLRI